MSKMNAFNNTDSDKLYRKFVVKTVLPVLLFTYFRVEKYQPMYSAAVSMNGLQQDMKWKRCVRRSFSPVQHALQTWLLFLLMETANTIVLKTHQGTFLFFY